MTPDIRGPLPREDFSLLGQPLRIRTYTDIPDLFTMDIAPPTPVVDGFLYSGTMTLLAGPDGVAKTFLAQSMSVAVATGATFLGRQTRQTPTLYLDFENPGYAVKDRMELLTGMPDEPQPIPNMKIWGTWLEHQPPQIGSDLLLQICRQTKPLRNHQREPEPPLTKLVCD